MLRKIAVFEGFGTVPCNSCGTWRGVDLLEYTKGTKSTKGLVSTFVLFVPFRGYYVVTAQAVRVYQCRARD